MSRASVPLAGFQVTFNGRFWVTPEVFYDQQGNFGYANQVGKSTTMRVGLIGRTQMCG
jgi:hypothetical protein